jgi:hypothetical protein
LANIFTALGHMPKLADIIEFDCRIDVYAGVEKK